MAPVRANFVEREENLNIYVGNLSFNTTETELFNAFANYGTVKSARIATDRDTGRPRGFGFVEMDNPAEAEAAINALNGSQLAGRVLTVNEARPREDRQPWRLRRRWLRRWRWRSLSLVSRRDNRRKRLIAKEKRPVRGDWPLLF
jgi:RNA recognition motif-containing protein